MLSRTYIIIMVVLLCISAIALTWWGALKIKNYQQRARIVKARDAMAERRAAESNAVVAKVEARRETADVANAHIIELSPYINCSLTSSFVPKNATNNNLAELGESTQTLAGVPFRIRGSIQLTGKDLRLYGKGTFPKEVGGIRVDKTCFKLHILHGSYFIKQLGTTIAKLVIHYADGSTQEIPIVSGKHVLDWWAPNYETGVRQDWRNVTAPGSELAWVGSNAYIRKRQPHLSLRLFKSTFDNPQPSVEINTVDYVSTDTPAAPFLLGLTVE